ncbi:hypothetical protein E2C01_033591 [Portunus trituberculatus]|uniref:Uncharacterized protein n=1 Tax=Portunus trituberculatus TaxID=210409 RepID=A0A5B7F3U5_PORTR|nr:hypothetical protein [Portunus trituberculatus]
MFKPGGVNPTWPLSRSAPSAELFLLHCPRFHSHRTALQSRLSPLSITTLDLPTLVAASGVHPSRQPATLRLSGLDRIFLRKTSQLPRL